MRYLSVCSGMEAASVALPLSSANASPQPTLNISPMPDPKVTVLVWELA